MSSINFVNAWLLLIAVPIAALFAVPFFIAVRKDNVNAHNVASGIIHIVMALIIAFVAAGTSVVTTVTETDVYVLADVSYSANRNLDAIDGYISDLGKSLPDNSRMGVICFGRDYKLISRLGERVKSVKQSGVDDSATDIVGALDFAGSLFRDNVVKRIVVITDGKQTGETDSNALKRQVDALADRKIHVDAIYLDDNLKEDAREVQLSGVQFTQTACLNRSEQAVITVNCSCPEKKEGENEAYVTDAVLILYKVGETAEEIDRKPAYLVRGNNTVSFDLPTGEAGTFDYEVRIECSADANPYNNRVAFTQTVSGELKVLLISDKVSDYETVTEYYGEAAEIDFPYYVNTPCTVEELCVYDEIVISDIDVVNIKNYEMFLNSLDTAVSLFGKSLITFGDVHIHSHTSGELKMLSNMLPVLYGKSDTDPKLYSLVIDNSRSMELNGTLNRAKTAAKQIVNLLSDQDMVELVTFNGDAFTTHPRSPLSTDREIILEKIDSLTVRQGTDIGVGLRMALENMQSGRYSEKRVMLITDGLNFGGGDNDLFGVTGDPSQPGVLAEMRENGISVTPLDAGRGNDTGAESKRAKTRLEKIASVSGTTYFDISNSEVLKDVLENGLQQEMNNIYGGFSRIQVKRPNDSVLKGIDSADIAGSYVGNYVYSSPSAKAGATTVLTVEYRRDIKNLDVPLYSYWKYGNGKVSTFTSALSGDWVEDLTEGMRSGLIGNILSENTPEEKVETPFLLNMTSQDGYVSVTLTPETVRADAVTAIRITAPDGTETNGNLSFGTMSFDYSFVTSQVGKYAVEITYEYGGRKYVVNRAVNISYSAEYDSFAMYDASVLHKMVGANGKVSENGKLEIVNDASEIGLYNLSLSLPLLIVCVVLYAVDIAVRKLKWEDIKSLFKKVKKVNK